ITDDAGNNIGALLLHIDISNLNEAIQRVYLDVLLTVIIAVVLAFLAVCYITVRMTKPIIEMNNTVKRFSKGDYDARVRVRGGDEIGQLGRSFNDMADEINSLEQSRRSFVANVSHELRSPLTSMRGFLEAMEDGTIPPEEQPHYLNIVIGENKRMSSMVNDLLDLSRIESGQTVFKPERFDVHDLIVRTLLTFEARITTKQLDISVDFPEDRMFVWADQNQIAQVVRNLVDNAIKYTPDGGQLAVSTSANKRMVVVRVQDSGQGIAAEDVPHVFDRFFKGDKAHTPTGTASTGLGLSIVKRIIEQHGQNIYVESAVGRGSAFIFTLQRCDEERPPQEARQIRQKAKPKVQEAARQSAGGGKSGRTKQHADA
ncbi:MAG: HAMP domain-containing sensor histidine kinase, partial [Eubacteriales bacterium]|nr:HAMP domain-containing sensor histidine kinase [Eubacteriales bacterium]